MTRATRASVACLLGVAAFTAALQPTSILAQAPGKTEPAKPEATPKPVALTQAHIDGLLVAIPEMAKLAAAASDKPDRSGPGELDQLAKKSGFANADELEQVTDSFQAVVSGLDPETKSYIGVIPLANKRIEEIEADKDIPAKDKATAIKELKDDLPKTEPPKPSDDDIALVVKNYDKLVEMADGADQ